MRPEDVPFDEVDLELFNAERDDELFRLNFVPRYSDLTTVKPNWLVLLGSWFIFSPGVLFYPVALVPESFEMALDWAASPLSILSWLVLAAFWWLNVCVLYKITRRHFEYRRADHVELDE